MSKNYLSSTTEKWWGYLFAIAILGIVIVTFTIADSQDLPLTIIGAVLGVAMTVFATYFLFKGQSKQQAAMMQKQSELQMSMMREQHKIEGMQEKECEIFKQKLTTYNHFLDALRKYVTEPNSNSKKEVIFHTMALRMHANAETINDLDSNIIKLIEDTGGDSEVKTLVESLSAIAAIFYKELYGGSLGSGEANLGAFVEAIKGSQEDSSEDEKRKEAAEEEKEDAAALQGTKVTGWDEKINSLKSLGWILSSSEDSFTLSSKDTPIIISVYRKKGKYVVEASKEGDSDFSQSLKDNFKGSRRYGTWWRELPINNYGVTEGTLLEQLPINDKARASVIKWIDKLLGYIN